MRLWDVPKKKLLTTLHESEDVTAPGQGVFAVAFSPDGKRLAAGVNCGVQLRDIATNKVVYRLQDEEARCNFLAFSRNGRLLAWQAAKNTVRIWDTRTGKEVARLRGQNKYLFATAFSPDGQALATGSADETVRIWDITPVLK